MDSQYAACRSVGCHQPFRQRLVPLAHPWPHPSSRPVEEPKDLGFGSVVGGVNEKRLLNRDGTFNSRRHGLPFLSSLSFYHYFLTISWPRFFALTVGGYLGTNTLFALAYLACGADSLAGITPSAVGGGSGAPSSSASKRWRRSATATSRRTAWRRTS